MAGRSALTSRRWQGAPSASRGTTPSRANTAIRAPPPGGRARLCLALWGQPIGAGTHGAVTAIPGGDHPRRRACTHAVSQGPPIHLIEHHVQALIIQTATQRLELLTELPRVSSHHMRCESLLVLPYFDDRTMVLPTALLQHLKAHVAAIVAACLGQLLQQNEGFILAGRHCI